METVTKKKISSSNMLIFHQIFTDDDLLVEIFIRLPDLQSVVRCGAVCKRWNSIINSKYYRHQKLLREVESKSSSFFPFTILYRHAFNNVSEPLFEYSSISNNNNNSKFDSSDAATSTSNYLDFLPNWRDVRLHSSADDLLLVSREKGLYFVVCNPITKQYVELPRTPIDTHDLSYILVLHAGLVCEPQQQQLDDDDDDQYTRRYKVMLIWITGYDADAAFSDYYIVTYCSESGKWSEEKSLTVPNDLSHNPPLVFDGKLHWLSLDFEAKTVHGIYAFDPFRDADHPRYFRFIDFPSGLVQGSWQSYQSKVRLGLVQGRLRLSQLLVIKRRGFVLKVWELNYYDSDDHNRNMRTLVHDVAVKKWTRCSRAVVAFHPNDGNVLFLLQDKRYVYRCDIGDEKMERIGELRNGGDRFVPSYLLNFVLVHPFRPTLISAPPSI